MNSKAVLGVSLLVGLLAAAFWTYAGAQSLTVPEGFEIEEFADGLRGVRTLAFGPDGQLYAAVSRDGRIVRLSADGQVVDEVLGGLNRPYGLAFHDGWMYVGERHRVIRTRGPDQAVEVVVPSLPTGGSHWTREIVFGSDGMLYVAVGSSCNVCEERDPRRAAVTRYRPDGSGEEVFAEGLRNVAGLAVHPPTGLLWASQNERDMLGDDLPVEEINILDSPGEHFGWPYCHGDGVPNPEYDDRGDFCRTTTPPALGIQAHSAPLGMAFYTGTAFPPEYRGDLFVALHGSWNRSERTGYELVRVLVDGDRPTGYESFASGWLSAGRVSGRPVDVVVGPNGELFLSDDDGGRIYRIRWTGDES